MSLLSDLYKNASGGIPLGKSGISFKPFGPSFMSTGLKFQGSNQPAVTPPPVATPEPVTPPVEPKVTPPVETPTRTGVFSGAQKNTGSQIPSKYINPETGTFYMPEDIASKASNLRSKGGVAGDIPKYSGDLLTKGEQTREQLATTAAELNNARNNIATGENDPYGFMSKTDIPYSPDEIRAIRSAYAGIYDPAINSAFEKLKAKEEEDMIKFNTDENIRQYQATTGAREAAERSENSYVIKPGDDLRKIAAEKGLTYEALVAANSAVDEYNLKPGQRIVIPTGAQKTKTTDTESLIWQWLSTDEAQAMSDEDKRIELMRNGVNPEDFGLI